MPILLAADNDKDKGIPVNASALVPKDGIVLGPEGAVHTFFTVRVAAMVIATLSAFTAAFSFLEKWPVLDAAYFVCSTAATVGFGDMKPVGHAGRLLTCILGCCGVGILGTLVSSMLEARLFGDQPQPRFGGRIATMWSRLGLWPKAAVNFALLMLVGVAGLLACEPPVVRPSLPAASYLIAGTLTTAGLGDVIPNSRAAKNFIALYSLIGTLAFSRVVGRIALQPLVAERRAVQREVLASYGSELTEESLAFLARGSLVKRLGLSTSDDFCSRDEYSLLLLVQQGKISEEDLQEVRDAFDALDADGSGKLSRRDLQLLSAKNTTSWMRES